MARSAPIPISGRVVALTGGARGIGLATAQALAARGARVALGDLDGDEAARAAAGIGAGTLGLALDVTDRVSFQAFLDEARTRFGPLDVLINNAGVLHVGPFLSEGEAWTRREVDVNLHGVINGMRLALPAMKRRGSGHVVNVASIAARMGVPREAVYTATKHAVAGLSEAVRGELRGTGVELSIVMPGLVRTELSGGTTDARGALVLEPADVARAIAGTLERPRFDVFVPPAYGYAWRWLSPLPRGWREAALRLLGAERATASTTPAQRAAYEERMARRVPRGAEPGARASAAAPETSTDTR